MELVRVVSSHNLATKSTTERPVGGNTYTLNCSQYLTTHQNWQRRRTDSDQVFGIMTLNYEQIYVTDAECAQIHSAIKSASSPVMVD